MSSQHRFAHGLTIGSMCLLLGGRADAQGDTTISRELLTPLSRRMVAEFDSTRKLHPPGTARRVPWIVRVRNVEPKVEARFRRALLRATGGREFTSRDSAGMFIIVSGAHADKDSAKVEVDIGERGCSNGSDWRGSTVYLYQFIRRASGWQFIGQKPLFDYDPAPPPPPGMPPRGCSHSLFH